MHAATLLRYGHGAVLLPQGSAFQIQKGHAIPHLRQRLQSWPDDARNIRHGSSPTPASRSAGPFHRPCRDPCRWPALTGLAQQQILLSASSSIRHRLRSVRGSNERSTAPWNIAGFCSTSMVAHFVISSAALDKYICLPQFPHGIMLAERPVVPDLLCRPAGILPMIRAEGNRASRILACSLGASSTMRILPG